MYVDHNGIVARPSFSRARRRRRRSAPLLAVAATAAAAVTASAATAPTVATDYWTGGAAGTGNSWFTGSNWNTVDQTYNASGTVPAAGQPIVIDSTANASSYIGGTSSSSDTMAINFTSSATPSITFGNIDKQMPTTLYVDDTLAGGTTAYTLTFSGDGTGTAGATDLIALTSAVTGTVDLRGANGSGGSELLKIVLANSGNFNVANASATLEVDAPISNSSAGAFGLTKTGPGRLVLTGSNSFAGPLTLNAGTLEYTTTSALPFNGSSVNLNGGILQYYNGTASNIAYGRNFVLGAGTTSTFDVTASLTNRLGLNLTNPITGSGNIIIGGNGLGGTGVGSTTYSAVNTYTGTTTVGTNQILLLYPAGSAASSALTLNGGTLDLYTNRTLPTTFASLTVGPGAATVAFVTSYNTSAGATGNVSGGSSLGPIARAAGAQGTIDVTLPATGTLTTTSANAAGTAILGGYATANGGASWLTVATDGSGTLLPLSTFATDPTAATAASDFDVTASGTFTGSAVNSLRFNAVGPFTATTNGSLTVASGGILVTPSATAGGTIAGGTITSGNGTDLIAHVYGGPLLVTSQIVDGTAGPTGLTKAGTGTLILDGTASNTYTGPTAINAGTLQVGNGDANGSLGPNTTVVNNGVLAFNQSTPVVTSAYNISGTGQLQQNGPNTLVLTVSDSYTGGTVVNAGTLQFATTNYAGTGPFTINNGAIRESTTLTSARTYTLGAATSTIDVSAGGTFTLTGLLTGPGTLNVNNAATNSSTGVADAGTLLLEGVSNNYSGGTVVNAGTLYIYTTAAGTAAGSGNISIGAATLELRNYTYSFPNPLVLTSPSSTVLEYPGYFNNISGGIIGTGTLNKTGTGTLGLPTANNYSGGTVVTQGAITTAAAGAYGTGDLTVNPTNMTTAATDNASVTAAAGSLAATANVTVNSETADFNSSAGTAFGVGTLTLTGANTVASLAGNGVVALNGNALTVGGGRSTTFSGTINGAGGSLVVTGPGRLTLAGTGTYTGGTTVTGGTLAVASATALPTASQLTLGTGALVAATAHNASSAPTVLDLSSLTLPGSPGAWTATVDLANNAMVVHGGSLATVTSQAAQGFAGGTWNGSGGIVSTTAAADPAHLTAVGVIANLAADGVSPLYASLDGHAVAAGDILVAYTYYGDTNLDGVVNAADYTRVDAGFVNKLTGWANGDFNYDGVVDGTDYALMDNAFNQQTGGVTITPMVATAAAVVAPAVAAVPEPTSMAVLLTAGTVALLGRRRRRGT